MDNLGTQILTTYPWLRGQALPLRAANAPARFPADGWKLASIAAAPRTPLNFSTPDALVVIGASSPLLLCGLQTLVSETAGVRLACTSSSLVEFLDCCRRVHEAIALVDPLLGGQSIQSFMETLKGAAPNVRAVLVMDGNQPHRVREALSHGACGLIGRTAESDEIRAALRAAAEGRRYISAGNAAHLADSLALEDLTIRETQVLGLLAKGDCNKEIARGLDVSLGTVKTHVRAIMSKLNARSRTEAVHKAYRLGLVCLDA